MSEDLRYYFSDHDADAEPPIPAEEGWKQMQQLLDTALPVSAIRSKRRYYFMVGIIAGIALLLTTLPLKNRFDKTNTLSVQHKTAPVQLTPGIVEDNKADNQAALSITPDYAALSPGKRNTTQALHNSLSLSASTHVPAGNDDQIIKEHAVTGTKEQATPDFVDLNNPAVLSAVPDSSHTIKYTNVQQEKDLSLSSKKKTRTNNAFIKQWQLHAGIGTNLSFKNTAKGIQPYPFVSLQYHFSPRFFAAASLAILSSTGSDAHGIKRTVYINDTFNNISRYNEKLNYTKLSYADLSLTAGVKITDKVSLQGGIQLSRTINSKTNTILEPYDFNSNSVLVQDIPRLSPTPSAAPIYNNKIELQNFDIRYLAGINYDINKISLGLQYQGGLRPVLKGDMVSGSKNNLISLKVSYRLK